MNLNPPSLDLEKTVPAEPGRLPPGTVIDFRTVVVAPEVDEAARRASSRRFYASAMLHFLGSYAQSPAAEGAKGGA